MNPQLLREVPLFASLPDAELHTLAANLREVELPAGTLVLAEGEPGDYFYVILEGSLDVIKLLGTPDERLLATRTRTEFVGEMSLLHPEGRRTASVRARSNVKLLELSRADFDRLLHRQPALAYDLARVLSRYIQEATAATITDLQAKNRELAQAYQALQAAQAQIIEKEILERELEVARRIQESIVPRRLPQLNGFAFGARMLPARAVGGDLFDLIQLSEDTVGIAIGDVSGKGVPAALFMALTCSLLREEVRRHESPAEVLRGVNQHLLEMNDAGMFVTLLYGVLQGSTREFVYARAGHETPLVLTATAEIVSPPRSLGHPLAFIPEPALDEQVVSLPAGSTLLLYTDGVTDATASTGEFFGLDQLKHVLQGSQGLAPPLLCDELLGCLMRHAAGAVQADDITLVAIQAAS